jgi:predicted Zn-dependent peptidase
MKKGLIISVLFLGILGSFFLYNCRNKRSLPLTHLKNPCEIVIYNKLDAKQIYVTLVFKDAGVLQNSDTQHGISALVSGLLFRKIGGRTAAETEEKVRQLGITNLSVGGLSDDFVISFRVVKDQFKPALEFLISGFDEKFSENDLSYIKEFFPEQINPENSQPDEILQSKLFQNLYPNHTYGKNVTGSSDALAKITLKDINDFIKNNFALDNLKIYYAGEYSIEKLSALVDNISKFLQKKSNQNKIPELNKIEVNCTEEKIPNNNIRDVCGISTGIRLDNLSKQEKAALYIVADALFNDDNGAFLNTDIPMKFSYTINDREMSTVLVLTAFVQKKDSDRYLKMQKDFLSDLKLSQLKSLELSKKDFIKNQKIFSLRSMRNTLIFFDLPFENCNDEIYQKILEKIQQPKIRSTVSILAEETPPNR